MFKIKTAFSAFGAVALAALSLGVTAAPAQAANNCGTLQVSPLHSDTFYIDNAAGFDAGYIGYSVTNNGASAVSGRSVKLNSFTGGTVVLAGSESDTHALGSIAAGATNYVYFLAKSAAAVDDPNPTSISVSVMNGATAVCTNTDTINKVDDVLSTNASTISAVVATPNTATVEAGTDITVTVTGDSGNIGNGDNNDPQAIIMSPVTISTAFDAAHYRLKSARFVGSGGSCDLQNNLRFINLGSACDNGYTATYVFETLAVADQSIASSIQGETYIASGANIKHPDALPYELPKVLAKQKIVYHGNGGTGTMADTTGSGGLTVDDNTFTYDCHIFAGFNTQADGKGTDIAEGASYTDAGTLDLYAQWDVDPSCSPEELAASEAAASSELAATGSQAGFGFAVAGLALGAAGIALIRRKSNA